MSEIQSWELTPEEEKQLSPENLEKYLKAKNYMQFEEAYFWTQAHAILEELGWERKERSEGHRCFVRFCKPDIFHATYEEYEDDKEI